jgi:hypothetical protein
MYITTNKQNSADRAQGLRYFAYFRTLAATDDATKNNTHISNNLYAMLDIWSAE